MKRTTLGRASIFDWNDYAKRATWVNAITTLKTVKIRTGIDFLKGLSVESAHDSAYWNHDMPDTPGDCQ